MQILTGGEPSYHILLPPKTGRKGNPVNPPAETSVISGMQGTKFELTTGKIFLEDIDEHLYHIDRMIRQLKLSGKLENLAGLTSVISPE